MNTNRNFPAPPANEDDEAPSSAPSSAARSSQRSGSVAPVGAARASELPASPDNQHPAAAETDGFDPYRFGPIHYTAQFFRKLVSTPLPEVPSEDLWQTLPPTGGAPVQQGGPASVSSAPSHAGDVGAVESSAVGPRVSGPAGDTLPEQAARVAPASGAASVGGGPGARSRAVRRARKKASTDVHGAATVIVSPRGETQPARGRLSPTAVERLKGADEGFPSWLPSVVVALSAVVFAAVFWLWSTQQNPEEGSASPRSESASSAGQAESPEAKSSSQREATASSTVDSATQTDPKPRPLEAGSKVEPPQKDSNVEAPSKSRGAAVTTSVAAPPVKSGSANPEKRANPVSKPSSGREPGEAWVDLK